MGQNLYTRSHIMVFVTAKSWKQYKDPAIGEQLNEYVAIQLVLHKLLKCL